MIYIEVISQRLALNMHSLDTGFCLFCLEVFFVCWLVFSFQFQVLTNSELSVGHELFSVPAHPDLLIL